MPAKKKVVRKRRKRRVSRRAKRGEYTSTKSGKVHKYRSNWEKVYMEHLDSNDDVSEWDYEPFKIPYVSNKRTGKIRHYMPDIYVVRTSGLKELIEIKPSKKVTQTVVIKKANAAYEWCKERDIEYKFVTEVELKELKLL